MNDSRVKEVAAECNKLLGISDAYFRDKFSNAPFECEKHFAQLSGTRGVSMSLYHPSSYNSTIAQFNLVMLPGCCGVVVSHGMFIAPDYRDKKLNNLLNSFKIEMAVDAGYSLMICTDISTNEPEKKTLARNGWKDIYRFTNKRTHNVIDLTIKDI